MKTRSELLKALGRLVVETGSLACLGCGWEQDCGVHGCAILRGVKAKLEEESARADEAETALTAAVRDMETMALTIRQRRDHDTECCPFCHYDCPEEDHCPGWEGEECFRWRGADRSRKPTGDLSRDATKMVPLTLEQLRRRVEKAGRPVVVFVVTIDPDTVERDFDGEWEMFNGYDFVADGTWDTAANYGVTFEAYAVPPKPSTNQSVPGR